MMPKMSKVNEQGIADAGVDKKVWPDHEGVTVSETEIEPPPWDESTTK